MKIAIIGYGKMGKTIERIAIARGHSIVLKIERKNLHEFTQSNLKAKGVEVAIEFTNPQSALENIQTCLFAGVKVVCGSTAWLDDWDKAIESLKKNEGAFIYASNFSIGVNIFFEINRKLAKMMNKQDQYEVGIREIHHTAKLDAPSGTAITLSEGITENIDLKSGWTMEKDKAKVRIESIRKDPAPGTHEIKYTSEIDEIEIIHTARSRDGFAFGAVLAAEFLLDKKGLWTMKDVLDI